MSYSAARSSHPALNTFWLQSQGARGPATAALSENWVVYSYYSTVNQRFEVAVLEFYDVQTRDLSIPSLLLGNQSTTLSPFAPTPIEAPPSPPLPLPPPLFTPSLLGLSLLRFRHASFGHQHCGILFLNGRYTSIPREGKSGRATFTSVLIDCRMLLLCHNTVICTRGHSRRELHPGC